MPDLPDLPDRLLTREPEEGLELVLGAEGREKLRDEGARPDRKVEDPLDRDITRE